MGEAIDILASGLVLLVVVMEARVYEHLSLWRGALLNMELAGFNHGDWASDLPAAARLGCGWE